jgi:hypothetical protein
MSQSTLSLQTVLTVTPGLHERRVGDKVFLLDSKSAMHALENDVAIAIWDVMNGAEAKGFTAAIVIAALLPTFEVSEHRLQEDVLAFVSLLRTRGIIATTD